jgi:hypothetical protein
MLFVLVYKMFKESFRILPERSPSPTPVVLQVLVMRKKTSFKSSTRPHRYLDGSERIFTSKFVTNPEFQYEYLAKNSVSHQISFPPAYLVQCSSLITPGLTMGICMLNA